MLNQKMKDQWERQQESLIYLTRCLLMIRSLSQGCQSSGDLSIDALRSEAARKAINELADTAHNLPRIISDSMMHFVTLENGHPIQENLDKFNLSFERELSGLKRQLQMGLGEAPVTKVELDELLKRRSPESRERIKNLVLDEMHQPNPELVAQLKQSQENSMFKPGESSYKIFFGKK